jgi:VIT1/CCC1 family predicted Fe2+/Mn2+ transporter
MSADRLAILILSAIVVLGFGGVLIAWMVFPPKTDSNLLSALTGALAAGYLQVINYWFRSNKDGA